MRSRWRTCRGRWSTSPSTASPCSGSRASTVVLDGFFFLPEDTPPSPNLPAAADPWSDTRTLSLTNMDPLAVVAACPSLTHLHLGCFNPEDDLEELVHERAYPHSTDDAPRAALRLLDIFVDGGASMPPRAVDVTLRATRPVVLSARAPAEATALWGALARAIEGGGGRTRCVDVLLSRRDQPRAYSMTVNGRPVGVARTSPQQWLVRWLTFRYRPGHWHLVTIIGVANRKTDCPSLLNAAC